MAKAKETPSIHMELGKLKDLIRKSVSLIKEAKNDRTAHNADIQAAREALEAQGIPKRALSMAMSYSELDADQRAGFDVAYTILREALGCPFDGQLFDAEGQPATSGKKAKPAPEHVPLN